MFILFAGASKKPKPKPKSQVQAQLQPQSQAPESLDSASTSTSSLFSSSALAEATFSSSSMANTHHLKISKIAKSYNRPIIKDVTIEIHSGESVALLGPNGAGKTTTFYTIVGLVKEDAGRIYLDNVDITDLPIHKRAQLGIGYLPQEESVFRQLTVRQNIMAVLELRKLSKAQREAELMMLLEQFHITHIIDSLGQSLSGGEKRRVEIARALAAKPKFILLDEPFAGVDPISVEDIKDNIAALKKLGIGVLITDHNIKATLSICERAYIIAEGGVLASGTPEEILANSRVQEVFIPENYL